MQADASGDRRAIEGRRDRVAGTSIVNEVSLILKHEEKLRGTILFYISEVEAPKDATYIAYIGLSVQLHSTIKHRPHLVSMERC